MIGGETYSKETAIAIMDGPVKCDKTITIFKARFTAKLNILNGGSDVPVQGWITAADAWMATHLPDNGVKVNRGEW